MTRFGLQPLSPLTLAPISHRRRAAPPQPLQPEEERSLLGMGLSGLEYIGRTLDKPGAAARGVIHGLTDIAQGQRPEWGGGLLNLIPFSDTADITNPENRITGRDILENFGAPKNKPGLFNSWNDALWDVGGFGTEVLTDPLFWASGPLGTMTKEGVRAYEAARGARRLTKAEDMGEAVQTILGAIPGAPAGAGLKRATSPIVWSDQVRKGLRSSAGLRLPWQEHPFLRLSDLPGGSAADKMFAWLLERGAYGGGPISNITSAPVRGIRGLLSRSAENKFTREAQIHADFAFAEAERLRALKADFLPSAAARGGQLAELLQEMANHHGQIGDDLGAQDFMRTLLELPEVPQNAEIQQRIADRILGGQATVVPSREEAILSQLPPNLRGAAENLPARIVEETPIQRIQRSAVDPAYQDVAGVQYERRQQSILGGDIDHIFHVMNEAADDAIYDTQNEFVAAWAREHLSQEQFDAWRAATGRPPASVAGGVGGGMSNIDTFAHDVLQWWNNGTANEETSRLFEGMFGQTPYRMNPRRMTYARAGNQITIANEYADSMHGYLDGMMNVKNAMWEEANRLGLDIADLGLREDIITHFPRRKARLHYDLDEAREDKFLNIPGGSEQINLFARDPALTATKHLDMAGKTAARDDLINRFQQRGWTVPTTPRTNQPTRSLETLQQTYIENELREQFDEWMAREGAVFQNNTLNRKGQTLAEWQARAAQIENELFNPYSVTSPGGRVANHASKATQIRNYFHKAPAEMLETGLFSHNVVEDLADYMESIAGSLSTIREVHHFLGEPGVISAAGARFGGVSNLQEAWGDAKYAEHGLQAFLNEHPNVVGMFDENLAQRISGGNPLDLAEAMNVAQNLEISPEAANAIKAMNQLTRPGTQNTWVKHWDQINSLYKWSLTTPFPSFHSRNLLSGMWQSWSDGRISLPKLLKGYTEVAKHIGNPTKHPLEGDFLKFLETSGLLKNNHMMEIAGEAGSRQLPEQGLVRGIIDLLGPEAAQRRASEYEAYLAAKTGVAPKTSRLRNYFAQVNPLNIPGVRNVPKGAKAPSNVFAETGRHTYEWVEALNRAGYAKALWNKGYRPSEIVNLVNKAQFDYSKVSKMDAKVLARIFPFHRWARLNVPFQLGKMLERPGGITSQTIRAFTQNEVEGQYTPEFMREQLSIVAPNLPGWLGVRQAQGPGEQSRLRQSGLPVEDFNKYLAFGPGGAQRILEKQAAQAAPLITLPMKVFTGRDLFFGRNLRDIQSPLGTALQSVGVTETDTPFGRMQVPIDLAERSLPTGRVVTEFNKIMDPRHSWFERVANATTGLRFSTYDIEKWKMLDLVKAQERIAEATPGVREKKTFYAARDKEGRQKESAVEETRKLQRLEALRRRFFAEREAMGL